MKTKKLIALISLTGLIIGCTNPALKKDMESGNQTEVKSITVKYEDNGYLDQSIIDEIRDEQVRIKAISAFEYALPIVGLEQWHKGFLTEANHGDWVIYDNRESKLPIITANTTTPYVVSFVNLAESSYYIEIPAGPIGGVINDIYQTPQTDLGAVGPDQGKGGKYLLVGPESEVPENNNADFIVKSKSNLVLIGTRIIGLTGDAYEKTLKAHKIYKFGSNGDNQKFVNASASNAPKWMGYEPHGMEFWEDLNRVLQNEPVVDRNRFILTQLRGTGIEKGEAFNPDERQKEILVKAEDMGNAIAMVNTFSRESYKEKHWTDRSWLYILNMAHLDQIAPHFYEVQEIASYTYEAVTTSNGMVLSNVGKGSKYLGAYIDNDGNWLDGKNNYVVVVPKDAPANQFWSITVYDNDTRCIIQNTQGKSDISSVMEGLKVEDDGNTKIFIGDKAPEGYENNWIQSNPKKGFFVYLRLYGPLESFFDKSWKMPNVEKIK